ncbi:MAG: N-6 DNA methylase [Bacteroidia bacterium]|nr:N-6 DNA methylase [Bacteroidia bacterium]
MLDNITKKNIDDCRDVLVGKVPDPKSQIEQITLALIYKFMDDMDKEAVEKFKGKAKFFTGEYAKYGWRKLFDPSLSGQDMLSLYSEALEKLNTNPNIPELFRNIFKNAYLPYRDPATLKLFLKHINEFEYSHSEKLGDAFEYLLSVMGSQGDAGQFRTPRHIIDFVTACVNPQKNETVLDPACGTAGFLLSAYKHILNQNTEKRLGDKLKPDDRKKLATNFVGYDISPDMVRLSLANMYLHGFATPQIHEYDTLSSEDRWQETFDVILANPPFMTPKGGIRPHKKFGVQANKAEVLFTDYIVEHLNSNGRAGIVVPNGIVATSQTAYKQLRKMLVQDSLIAVISLPAGCFNPYSGVKTSILILDKKLAKKSQHILFLKIESDGFDLGAQRREIDKNDLPLALQTLESYKECLSNDKAFEELPSLATIVDKELILATKDILLTGDRYKSDSKTDSEYGWVTIESISELFTDGDWIESKDQSPNGIRLVQTGNVGIGEYLDKTDKSRFISEETFNRLNCTEIFSGDVLVSRLPDPVGRACLIPSTNQRMITAVDCTIIRFDKSKMLPELFVAYTKSDVYYTQLKNYITGASRDRISRKNLAQIEIPLPPLEIQQQIVAEIEGYQKIIDGAKQIVNNYKPTIKINPDWEMVELGSITKLVGGSTPSKDNSSYWENGNIDWITCSDFANSPMFIEDSIRKITGKAVKECSTSIIPEDTLVLVTRVSLGKMAFVKKPTALNQDLTALLFDEEQINKRYAYFYLLSIADKIERDGHGATVKGVTRDYIRDINVPLPSLEEQLTIVKAIEEELQWVNASKRLIEVFEQKIKDKIREVWGVKEEVETV